MSRLLITLVLVGGLGIPSLARADGKVDWSQYIEKPSDRANLVAKPIPLPDATPQKSAKAAKPAKVAKATKPAKTPKHRAAEKAKPGRHR